MRAIAPGNEPQIASGLWTPSRHSKPGRKGRRPGFDAAAEPELAESLYEKVIALIAEQGVPVEKGVFGEYMHITSINDGPVTFLLDSSKLF